MAKPSNLLLIITDQQRYPISWPRIRVARRADAGRRRTGSHRVTFEGTCIASCMLLPEPCLAFTGRWPAEHGVDLT